MVGFLSIPDSYPKGTGYYHMQEYNSHVGDLSAFLARLAAPCHGPGFRRNCEMIAAYEQATQSLTILDQIHLLDQLE